MQYADGEGKCGFLDSLIPLCLGRGEYMTDQLDRDLWF